jgi:hypothetical protein
MIEIPRLSIAVGSVLDGGPTAPNSRDCRRARETADPFEREER